MSNATNASGDSGRSNPVQSAEPTGDTALEVASAASHIKAALATIGGIPSTAAKYHAALAWVFALCNIVITLIVFLGYAPQSQGESLLRTLSLLYNASELS